MQRRNKGTFFLTNMFQCFSLSALFLYRHIHIVCTHILLSLYNTHAYPSFPEIKKNENLLMPKFLGPPLKVSHFALHIASVGWP